MSAVSKNNAAAHTGREGSGTSHFFYTTASGKLASFKKEDTAEYYQQLPISIQGGFQTFTRKGSAISAVGYTLGGENQLRVYYVDTKNKLFELCWSESKGYFVGALTDKNYIVAEDSGLAASVSGGLIEVYCKLEKYDDSYARIWLNDPNTKRWNDETLVRSQDYE